IPLKFLVQKMLSRLITRCQGRLAGSIRRTSSAIEKKKDSDMLETIDIEDLPRAQKRYAKQFEKINQQRIKEIFERNYKNHISFTVLAVLVVAIYCYTLYAVKQETFLEEIDEEVAAEKPKTHGHL
ncbi:hypothetical protein PMAYCL1PPCAC_02328, partial [Pristionchus mayeri]